ncbi:MAG: cellobiose phosphorylase [Eubacteriales bacterium]|nr:cellobiose phosphorylase [Eubacteriales bacterium]
MAAISVDLNMKRISNDDFLKKADACAKAPVESVVKPLEIVRVAEKENTANFYPKTEKVDEIGNLQKHALKKGEKICVDFGDHYVGYVTLKLASVGSPQDAPAYFRLKFAEIAKELTENSADYDGWVSRSWIQEELIHVDVLPTVLTLPRRYAFRYVELEVLDTSPKWQLVVEEVSCRSVSAVGDQDVPEIDTEDELLKKIDKVSIRTLRNCMQDVFEDGPKRDRRLWLGDLRMQALTNYATFKNYDLVKRCLYLFAGQTKEDGQVSACMFVEPKIICDDTFLRDYSMMFGVTLLDYYEATKDLETLKELAPCAYRQMEIAEEQFDEKDTLICGEGFWGFIDWTDGLDKQAAMQGVYIYCARRVVKIAEILEDREREEHFRFEVESKMASAQKELWDEEQQVFVSGSERQVSYASQVWMILAEVLSAEDAGKLLDRIREINPDKKMVSPFMNHYYMEALLFCGRKEEAMEYMKYYWGGMVLQGADTFWELYNPENPAESPYGSSIVNSYCHAWSCSPAYLLRKK